MSAASYIDRGMTMRPSAASIFVWEYRPGTPLTPGRHEVTIAYGDGRSIARTYRWAFEVQPIVCSR